MNVRNSVTNNMSLKKIIKRGMQHIAVSFGRHARASKEPQLLILMYHRILPQNDERAKLEEPGMIVTPETFRMHMSLIKKYFNVLSLSQWIRCKNNGEKLPLHSCAITFDDGWADNYEFAFPILCELELPATIFLVSDMIDTNKKFWPERFALIISAIAQDHSSQWSHPVLDWIKNPSVSYQFTTVVPTQEELTELIANAKAFPDHEIHARLDKIEEVLKLSIQNNEASLLNWQQVSEMNDSGLVESGSHTCNHIRLNNKADDNVVEYEIMASKKQIEEKTGHVVKTFCFPNGDYSDKALELVRQYYEGGVSTEAGWNSVATDSCLLHRIGIHEDIAKDEIAFLARISGWM